MIPQRLREMWATAREDCVAGKSATAEHVISKIANEPACVSMLDAKREFHRGFDGFVSRDLEQHDRPLVYFGQPLDLLVSGRELDRKTLLS
jgi:hypothetical protein